jgi:hypothetical protein
MVAAAQQGMRVHYAKLAGVLTNNSVIVSQYHFTNLSTHHPPCQELLFNVRYCGLAAARKAVAPTANAEFWQGYPATCV